MLSGGLFAETDGFVARNDGFRSEAGILLETDSESSSE